MSSGKGFLQLVDEELLDDGGPAAAVFKLRPRDHHHPHRRGVGRLLAIQHLHQRGKRLADGIAGKAMDAEAGAVAEQPAGASLSPAS